jgi:hypothetical protein
MRLIAVSGPPKWLSSTSNRSAQQLRSIRKFEQILRGFPVSTPWKSELYRLAR